MSRRHSADAADAIVTALSARLDALVASWESVIVAQRRALAAVDGATPQEPASVLAALERELNDLERHCWKHRQTADDETREATAWEGRAMAAIREGHDDLARQAIARLTEYVTAAAAASDEATALEGVRDAYRNAVAAVRATVSSAPPSPNAPSA